MRHQQTPAHVGKPEGVATVLLARLGAGVEEIARALAGLEHVAVACALAGLQVALQKTPDK